MKSGMLAIAGKISNPFTNIWFLVTTLTTHENNGKYHCLRLQELAAS